MRARHRSISRRSAGRNRRWPARRWAAIEPGPARCGARYGGRCRRASGADALDDPTISDSYQYYKDPGVFSAHTVMLTQSFPLWGKRDLRREAALADVDAARGRERAAQDEIDEKIKVAYAQYYLISRDIAVNQEVGELARRMRDGGLRPLRPGRRRPDRRHPGARRGDDRQDRGGQAGGREGRRPRPPQRPGRAAGRCALGRARYG